MVTSVNNTLRSIVNSHEFPFYKKNRARHFSKRKPIDMNSLGADQRNDNKKLEDTLKTKKNSKNEFGDRNTKSIKGSLRVKKLSQFAYTPKRGSEKSAGYDLSSAEGTVVPANCRALVKTDIAIALPPGTYGRVAPRSGLALNYGITTGAGVIDEDYRGPVNILLFNLSDRDFKVERGDRIAQLIIELIITPDVEVVESLDETVRGENGFGSTGTKHDDEN